MPMDWDRLRVFQVVADAGSFTHAGDVLQLSQSSVSRQISALEEQLNLKLFHRHARGLVLTEEGELLYKTTSEMKGKLEKVADQMMDASKRPSGDLRITAPVGLGSIWLTPHLKDFIDLYPQINLHMLLSDEDLDLTQREADVALWLHQPSQQELIQRKLFTVQFHVFAANSYLRRFGIPKTIKDLDDHRIITFGGRIPAHLRHLNWLEDVGMPQGQKRTPRLTVNNLQGVRQALRRGVGLVVLPDYLTRLDDDIVPVLTDEDMPVFDSYFVYPQELKNSKRVSAFRDFLVAKAKDWRN